MLTQVFDEIATNRGFRRESTAQGEQVAAVKPVGKLLNSAEVDNEIAVAAYEVVAI